MPNSKELHAAISAAIQISNSFEEICANLFPKCLEGGRQLSFTPTEQSAIYEKIKNSFIFHKHIDSKILTPPASSLPILHWIRILSRFATGSMCDHFLRETARSIAQIEILDLATITSALCDLPSMASLSHSQLLLTNLLPRLIQLRQEGKILDPIQIAQTIEGLLRLHDSNEVYALLEELIIHIKYNTQQKKYLSAKELSMAFRGLQNIRDISVLEKVFVTLLPHMHAQNAEDKLQRFNGSRIRQVMYGLHNMPANYTVLQILACLTTHIEHLERPTDDLHRDRWMDGSEIANTLYSFRNMIANEPEAQNVINRFLQAILPRINDVHKRQGSLSIGQTKMVLEGLANFSHLSAASQIILALQTHLQPPRFPHYILLEKLITDMLFQLSAYFDYAEDSDQYKAATQFVNAITTRFPKLNARRLNVQLESLMQRDLRQAEIIRMGHFMDHETHTLDLSECSPKLATMLCDNLLDNWKNAADTQWTIKFGAALYDDRHAKKMRFVVELALESRTTYRLSYQWEEAHVVIKTATNAKRSSDAITPPPSDTESSDTEGLSPEAKKPSHASFH